MNFNDSLNQIANTRNRYLAFQPPGQGGALPPLGTPPGQTPTPAPTTPPVAETPTTPIPPPAPTVPPPAQDAPNAPWWQGRGGWGHNHPWRRWGNQPDTPPAGGTPPQGLPPIFSPGSWQDPRNMFPSLFQTILGPQRYEQMRSRWPLPPLGGQNNG